MIDEVFLGRFGFELAETEWVPREENEEAKTFKHIGIKEGTINDYLRTTHGHILTTIYYKQTDMDGRGKEQLRYIGCH